MYIERGDHPSSELSTIIPTCCNTPDDVLYANIKSALKYPIIKPIPPHDVPAIIVGGGPSVRHELATLARFQAGTVFALNGAGLWLQKQGIIPHAVILLDARPLNVKFITGLDSRVKLYLATQCHSDIFSAAEANGNPIVTWHAANSEEGVDGIVETRSTVIIGAGTSVGMRALRLVHVLGFRNAHLFGYDSSYAADESHAYAQPENEDDAPRGCMVGGRWFTSTGWMIRQADDFQHIAAALLAEGMHIHVHGDGLLPEVAREMEREALREVILDDGPHIHPTAQIHPFAHVGNDVKIGARSKVWQFASVIRGTVLGEDCNVASGATLDGPRFGDRCIISQNVAMGPGFIFGDDVFVGPNVTICNDMWPWANKLGFEIDQLRAGHWTVIVKDGAVIGANAVVLPGVTIGDHSVIAAGAVVDRDVPDRSVFRRNGQISPIDPTKPVQRMRYAC